MAKRADQAARPFQAQRVAANRASERFAAEREAAITVGEWSFAALERVVAENVFVTCREPRKVDKCGAGWSQFGPRCLRAALGDGLISGRALGRRFRRADRGFCREHS